ncbi:uncharacterized protein LOC142334198 [Lycorma delicatula]|uniref:uncharacterized protein LOC142334198 n=1 Tax=Lycorma delicatula TaxID=130591 RepID=UPI003F5160E1
MGSEAKQVSIFLIFYISVQLCSGVPTIYKKNENDKLEPVLIPVSSTVIPLPVYKVGAVVGIIGEKPLDKPPSETKLVTLASSRKKAILKELMKEKSKEQAKIKPVSQEEFIYSKEFV